MSYYEAVIEIEIGCKTQEEAEAVIDEIRDLLELKAGDYEDMRMHHKIALGESFNDYARRMMNT